MSRGAMTDRERIGRLEVELEELRRDLWDMTALRQDGVAAPDDRAAVEKIRAALRAVDRRNVAYTRPAVARMALLMMQFPGQYLTAEKLLTALSNRDDAVTNPVTLVNGALSCLRATLGDQGFPGAILCKYAVGWAMTPEAAGYLSGVLADD